MLLNYLRQETLALTAKARDTASLIIECFVPEGAHLIFVPNHCSQLATEGDPAFQASSSGGPRRKPGEGEHSESLQKEILHSMLMCDLDETLLLLGILPLCPCEASRLLSSLLPLLDKPKASETVLRVSESEFDIFSFKACSFCSLLCWNQCQLLPLISPLSAWTLHPICQDVFPALPSTCTQSSWG